MRNSTFIGLLIILLTPILEVKESMSEPTGLYSVGCYQCEDEKTNSIDFGEMIVGSGKNEEADENCDKNGCKRDFTEEFNLMIRSKFGQVYTVKSKEGLTTDIKVMIKDLKYTVPTTFLYHSVRGIVVARWGVNKKATDGELYSHINDDCDNNPITLKPTNEPQDVHGTTVEELDKQGMIRTNDKLNCHAWEIDDDWNMTNKKCTKVWGTGNTWMTVQKSMMYDPHDLLLVHSIDKTVSFSGKIAIEYNNNYKEAEFDSSMEQGATIKIDDNISLEHDGWGDLVADLPNYLVTRCTPTISGKDDTDLISNCKVVQTYVLTSAPEKGVVTSSGLGEFQVVRVGSDDLIYDKSKYETIVLSDPAISSYTLGFDEHLGQTRIVDMYSNQLPITTLNNFLMNQNTNNVKPMYNMGTYKKWGEPVNSAGDNNNLKNNNKPGCVLQFMSPSASYIDTVVSNYYEAKDKLKSKEWITFENISYIQNEPQLQRLEFQNLMKVMTKAKLIGKDVEFEFKDDKGLVTNLKQVKCVIYTTSSGSYITYSFNYAGSGNTVKIGGSNLQLATSSIIVEKSGLVTDTVGIKNILDLQKELKFCVNEVCIKLDPEYKKNKDGGSDDPDVDPDVDPSNTEIYEFMRYMFTGIISAMCTVIMIIIDIILAVIVVYTCAKVLKKLAYRGAWVLVYLITFGRYRIGVYSQEVEIVDFTDSEVLKSGLSSEILQGSRLYQISEINFDALRLNKEELFDMMLDQGIIYGCSDSEYTQTNGKLLRTKDGIIVSNDTMIYKKNYDGTWDVIGFSLLDEEKDHCAIRKISLNNTTKEEFYNAMTRNGHIEIFKDTPQQFKISGDSCFLFAGVDSFKLDTEEMVVGMIFCDTTCYQSKNHGCQYRKVEISVPLSKEWTKLIRPPSIITSDVQKTVLGSGNHSAVVVNSMMSYMLYNGRTYVDVLKQKYQISGQTDIKCSCSNDLEDAQDTRLTLCTFVILCLDKCTIEPINHEDKTMISQIEKERAYVHKTKRVTTYTTVKDNNIGKITFANSLSNRGKMMESDSRIEMLRYIETNASPEKKNNLLQGFLKNTETDHDTICHKRKCIKMRNLDEKFMLKHIGRNLLDHHHLANNIMKSAGTLSATLQEMHRRGKYDYVLQLLDTNENRIYHDGNSYKANLYGPIKMNCIKSNTSNTNYLSACISNNAVALMYDLHQMKELEPHVIKLPMSNQLFAGMRIESTMYQQIGILPNDHQCAGTQMWNTDGSVSCSDDCCLITSDNWEHFQMVTADTTWSYDLGDYVRWGEDPPVITVEKWYVSEDTSVKSTLSKRIGCKRCQFNCMMECSRKVFTTSYWCFWFSWAIIIGIGCVLALISAITGITINTSYARYLNKGYYSIKNIGENLSSGNLKVWTRTKHMDDYYKKYDKYNPDSDAYKERKERIMNNRKRYFIERNDKIDKMSKYA